MIRTQISLPQAEYSAAKREASRLGISLAEFFRRALRGMLPVDESSPWMRYAGMVETGDSASSQSIDDVVYGCKD
ncbi:MAG: CopG family transcriptional regulator [Actinomycetota bacterium]